MIKTQHDEYESITYGITKTGLMTSGVPRIRIVRVKIPGGWLVGSCGRQQTELGDNGVAFIPDPNHEWDGSPLP